MYCIINQTKDIIAADEEFFSLLKSDSLMGLYRQIATGAIDIAFEKDEVTIANLGDVRSYPIKSFDISGLLSQSKIIEILTDVSKNEINNAENVFHETFDDQKEKLSQDNKPIKAQEDILPDTNTDNPVFSDIVFDESQNSLDKPHNTTEDKTTYTEVVQPQESSIATADTAIKSESSKIDLDTHTISQKMGLSKTEYIAFLQEYVQTAKSLKKDLESTNKDVQKSAINFIKHLSDVLHLPENISSLVIELSSSITQKNINKFYDAIDQISINNEILKQDSDDLDSKQENIKPIESQEDDKTIESEGEGEGENLQQPASSIDLSDVTPVKFDFALEETANTLSLPDDIVKDFIQDFIEQCHTEITNLLDAYEKGDTERIKKIARLLKGVASNLYITPIAQSLLELQYNDDIKLAEPLIKKFWALFVAFEDLMKNK
ncbi:MAG: hypothetical protein ACWGHH_03540 [Sulfurovaceae bacterium]